MKCSRRREIIAIAILVSSSVYSQTISPLPPGFNSQIRRIYFDNSSQILYAAGNFTAYQGNVDPISKVAQWNGVQWDSLGSGVNDGGQIFDMCTYNGELVCGGSFKSIGGISGRILARWDGNSWQPFPGSPFGTQTGPLTNSHVDKVFVDGSSLYVGGAFDTVNGNFAQGIVRYDGSVWHTFPSFGNGWFSVITAVTLFNNELYIGGNFDYGSGKKDILKFDGVSWVSVGGGLSGPNTWVNDFEIYQNKLYVAGYFNTVYGDPGNNIAIWDGVSWSQPGIGLMPANVWDLHIFDNKLIACGQINEASGIPVSRAAIWDGVSWMDLYGIIFQQLSGVGTPLTITSSGNDLYFGGSFSHVNGIAAKDVVKLGFPTGITDGVAEDKSHFVFPNPTQGTFSLNISECWNQPCELELLDMMGKRLLKKFLTPQLVFHDIQLPDNFSNGIYSCRVTFQNESINIKLVVKR